MNQATVKDFPPLLEPYCYKTITYRYWGRNYYLNSSQHLFSSVQIDRGSQLLLTSLLPTHTAVFNRLLPQVSEISTQQPYRLSIWDWGCGIGTLGLMAQGHCGQLIEKQNKLREQFPPQQLFCELRCFDRNALALAFTETNWQQNIQPIPGFSPSLHIAPGIWGEECLYFEESTELLKELSKVSQEKIAEHQQEAVFSQLVLSNIPAKIGGPVLRQILPALAASPFSYVAIVIVSPLRHLLQEAAAAGEIEILHFSGSGDHCIVHYCQPFTKTFTQNWGTGTKLYKIPPVLKLYKRGESCFALERKGSSLHLRKSPRNIKSSQNFKTQPKYSKHLLYWPFRSAYGLADFDTPGYALELMIRLLIMRNWGGNVLLWEAGHGHLACFLAMKPGFYVQHIDLAGRDRLGLLFSQHNLQNLANLPYLQKQENLLPSSSIHSLPCLEAMPLPEKPQPDNQKFWSLIIVPLEKKLTPTQAQQLRGWLEQQAPGTWLCLQGSGSVITYFKKLRGWSAPRMNNGGNNGLKAELRGHGLTTQLWYKEH